MPLRPPAGFISAFYDPLNNPNAPTIGTATAGDASASVAFTPPANVGGSAISAYSAISTPEGIIGSAASSPISVTGLTNGTAYTFAVWATNTYGPSAFSASSNSVSPAGIRGIFSSGVLPNPPGGNTNIIDFITIATTGNATDFGDLVAGTKSTGSCASSTRGLIAGGASQDQNVIQYITFATTGNTTDFGDLVTTVRGYTYGLAGCNSSTRGLFGGGSDDSNDLNIICYVTIASTGNATDFGDLTTERNGLAACSNGHGGL